MTIVRRRVALAAALASCNKLALVSHAEEGGASPVHAYERSRPQALSALLIQGDRMRVIVRSSRRHWVAIQAQVVCFTVYTPQSAKHAAELYPGDMNGVKNAGRLSRLIQQSP